MDVSKAGKTVSELISEKKALIKNLGRAAAGLALGLARVANGVAPFGLALLCAAKKKQRAWVFGGVLTAALFDSCVPLALFCAAFAFFVLKAKETHGGVTAASRIAVAAACAALRAAYIAAGGINGASSVFSLVAAAVSCPLAAAAFRGYFDKKKELRRVRYEVSLLAFAFAFTSAAARFSAAGINLGLAPAAIFTLCAAKKQGFAQGCAFGVVCGLASGGAATGALGVMGLAFGLLAPEAEPLALALAYMLSVCGYFYLAGAESTPAAAVLLLISVSVFIPLSRRIKPRFSAASARAERRAADKSTARCAAAFSSLSSLFYTVSDPARAESITALNRRIVAVADDYCARCANYGGCGLDKSEMTNFCTSEIRRSGVVSYSRIPGHITQRCPNAGAIARGVNELRFLRGREEERGLKRMADEYSAVSEILAEAGRRGDEAGREDRAAAREIKRALAGIGVECDGARVLGGRLREVTVYGVDPEKMRCTPRQISACIAQTAGTNMTEPEFLLHDGYTLMRTRTAPCVRLECAKFTRAKSGEPVCGDTVSVFETDEKRFFCLISDGMGSGREASMTSKLAALMLEKLLRVGADKESAMRMMNKALNEKSGETFATVDMLEIDRVTMEASVVKAGAAPTLLLRGGKTFKLESRTPPAGIMRGVIAEKKSFKVRHGDVIVMLSDGVLQTGNEQTVLPQNGLPPMPSARALAAAILRSSGAESESADDMSVCVIRVI